MADQPGNVFATASARFLGGRRYLRTFVRLAGLIYQNKFYLFAAIVCMAGYNIFTAAPAWYIKPIVDGIEKGRIPEISRFALVGFGIVLIYTLKGLFSFGQSYLMGLIGQRLIYRLRTRLYAHLQGLSFSFFANRQAGDLITRFTSDLVSLQNGLRMAIAGPLRDVPQILILLFIMVYRSWELFIVSLVLIPIAFFLISRFGRRNSTVTAARLVTFGEMTSLLMETISGIRVVKAFGMEKYEQKRFESANEDVLRKHMRSVAIAAYATPVLEVIGAVAGATIVMTGGFLIIHDKITGGDFVSFLFAFFMLNDPIKSLNGLNLILQEGLAAANRVFDLLEVESEVAEKPGARALGPIRTAIEIDVERFQYPDKTEPALHDVRLTVPAGDVVALVGTSGSGKTTLVNLIPRFFDLQHGSIKIDGSDIQDVTLASLRDQIAIVTQEIFLFNDTVANNIAYGKVDCPKEAIEEAARAANAYDFIMELPRGFETSIGQGGFLLSGGQRQRLAIARALIKDAPILILDEATSALDSESEVEVQQALENLLANRTTIVIAHRLSTVYRANTIHVMQHGTIVESGRHDELVQQGGQYKKLYEMQFRDVENLGSRQGSLRHWWNRLRADDPVPRAGSG